MNQMDPAPDPVSAGDSLELSDEQLMDSYNGCNSSAYEIVYRRHFGKLVRLGLARGSDYGQAEDLAQSILVIVMLSKFKTPFHAGEGTFKAWLWRVSYNKFVDEVRRRRRAGLQFPAEGGPDEGESATAVDPVDPAEPGPEISMAAQEHEEAVEECMETLSASDRELLWLTAEGHSREELAKALGITRNALYARLYHARDRLADCLLSKNVPVKRAMKEAK